MEYRQHLTRIMRRSFWIQSNNLVFRSRNMESSCLLRPMANRSVGQSWLQSLWSACQPNCNADHEVHVSRRIRSRTRHVLSDVSQHICCRQGLTRNLPAGIKENTGRRLGGHDYYLYLIIRAIPAALEQQDLSSMCQDGRLVDRILQAGRYAEEHKKTGMIH